MYPTRHGIINHGFKVTEAELKHFNESQIVLLPEVLKKLDYTTLAIDWLGRWHRRGYDFYNGLTKKNRLIDLILRSVKLSRELLKNRQINSDSVRRFCDEAPWGIRRIEEAKYVGNKAVKLIKKNWGGNFFLFIHFWDTHAYHFKGRTLEEKDQKYDEAIKAVDHEIGRIVNALADHDLLEKTLLIITADHGQSLTEHGIHHGHLGLYDETIHVPLIFNSVNLPTGKTVHGFVQHFDLMPTIFDILEIEDPGYFDGKSLRPLIEGKVEKIREKIYAEDARFHEERRGERAIRTRRYKYIFTEPKATNDMRNNEIRNRPPELYNLQADPRETINIINEDSNTANQLRSQYYDWIERTRHDRGRMEKSRIRKRIKVLISGEGV
jgi:arylsulfatase A-like enzyme